MRGSGRGSGKNVPHREALL